MKTGIKIIAWYKGLIGVFAILFALSAIFYGLDNLNAMVTKIKAAELQEDPGDIFFNFVVPYIPFFHARNFWLFVIFTFTFGIMHLILAYEVTRERYWPIVWVFWALLLLLPIEIVSLIKLFKLSRVILLIVNLFVIGYVYIYIKKFHKSFNILRAHPFKDNGTKHK